MEECQNHGEKQRGEYIKKKKREKKVKKKRYKKHLDERWIIIYIHDGDESAGVGKGGGIDVDGNNGGRCKSNRCGLTLNSDIIHT